MVCRGTTVVTAAPGGSAGGLAAGRLHAFVGGGASARAADGGGWLTTGAAATLGVEAWGTASAAGSAGERLATIGREAALRAAKIAGRLWIAMKAPRPTEKP